MDVGVLFRSEPPPGLAGLADRSARIHFEVRARNEYFDLLPILRRDRRIEEPAA